MEKKLKKLKTELTEAIDNIRHHSRYRAPKKKMKRMIEVWKEITLRYIEEEDDSYNRNWLYIISNALTYHMLDMEYEKAQEYIDNVLKNVDNTKIY